MHEDLIRRLRTRPTGDPYLHMMVHEAADALEAMQADAARYRWLRDGCDDKSSKASRIATNCYGLEWDAAIDAAMKVSGAADPVGKPAGQQPSGVQSAAPTSIDCAGQAPAKATSGSLSPSVSTPDPALHKGAP